MKDKGKWFKTDDLRTLIARVQDFFNVDLGYLIDKLLELERLAEIGKATERMLDDEIEGYMVSGRIVEGKFIDTKAIESVDELLEWYNAI